MTAPHAVLDEVVLEIGRRGYWRDSDGDMGESFFTVSQKNQFV